MQATRPATARTKSLQFERLSGQKRYESDADQVLLLNPLFTLYELDQLLRTGMRPERQHHHAAVGKLVEQRLRNGFRGGGDDDAVIGRPFRHAEETISHLHLDVVVAQRCQALA